MRQFLSLRMKVVMKVVGKVSWHSPYLWLVAVVAASLMVAACSGETATGGESASGASSVSQQGEALFNRTCSVCHGAGATGTQAGPPLVHELYHPGHHPDISFRNAVKDGVISHHWEFGHMPAQPGVSDEDIENIICYVRELQIAGGIYEGETPC